MRTELNFVGVFYQQLFGASQLRDSEYSYVSP